VLDADGKKTPTTPGLPRGDGRFAARGKKRNLRRCLERERRFHRVPLKLASQYQNVVRGLDAQSNSIARHFYHRYNNRIAQFDSLGLSS